MDNEPQHSLGEKAMIDEERAAIVIANFDFDEFQRRDLAGRREMLDELESQVGKEITDEVRVLIRELWGRRKTQ